MPKWAWQGAALVLCPALLILGLVLAEKSMRANLRDLDQFAFPFADIACAPPPGQTRADFLSEVQYLSSVAGEVRLLDDDLASRLADAFAAHPWVNKVNRVEILPNHQVLVELTYRVGVMAVHFTAQVMQAGKSPLPNGPLNGEPTLLAVDGQGIRLPAGASVQHLPIFEAGRDGPTGPAGKPWGVSRVIGAARTAAFLRKYQDVLQIDTMDSTEKGLVLHSKTARVLWGLPPGDEGNREALASQKIERLLNFLRLNGDLGTKDRPYEHDVRPKAESLHRRLPLQS